MKAKIIIVSLIIVIIITVAVFVLLKKSKKMSKNNFTEKDAVQALVRIKREHGVEIAKIVERLYRWETAHFKSEQYRRTGSPGMEAHGYPPYYGWASGHWKNNPDRKPIGVWSAYENKGMSEQGGNTQSKNKKDFLVFPSVYAAMSYLVDYINRYNGNYARWYSTSVSKQQIYVNALNSVNPKIVNNLA